MKRYEKPTLSKSTVTLQAVTANGGTTGPGGANGSNGVIITPL